MEQDPEEELHALALMRESYRNTRRSITELWIVAMCLLAILAATGWWIWGLAATGLAALALYLAVRDDISLTRGRELDAAWVEAKIRVLEQRAGETA